MYYDFSSTGQTCRLIAVYLGGAARPCAPVIGNRPCIYHFFTTFCPSNILVCIPNIFAKTMPVCRPTESCHLINYKVIDFEWSNLSTDQSLHLKSKLPSQYFVSSINNMNRFKSQNKLKQILILHRSLTGTGSGMKLLLAPWYGMDPLKHYTLCLRFTQMHFIAAPRPPFQDVVRLGASLTWVVTFKGAQYKPS